MTEYHRFFQYDWSEASVIVVMQVGTTDTAVGDFDSDLVISGGFLFAGFQSNVFSAVCDDGSHVFYSRLVFNLMTRWLALN